MIVRPTVRDSSDRWDSGSEDEMQFWPRVLWMDPGVLSGVAAVWFDPHALFIKQQPLPRCILAWWESYVGGPENDQIDKFLDLARQMGDGPSTPGLVLGVESFVMQQFNQSKEFLAPVRLRAKLEYAVPLWSPGRVVVSQSPSDALTTITDDRLKLWNMYTPGPDHIRDATRHCLLWIRKIRVAGLSGFRKWHGWDRAWAEEAA